MAERDSIIALDAICGGGGFLQEPVEQIAASRSRLAVGEPEGFAGQVVDGADLLRISRGDDESFLPSREGDDREIAVGELPADERQVEFTGFGVFKMRARDVDLVFLEPR